MVERPILAHLGSPIRGLRSMNCLLQFAHRMIVNRTAILGSLVVSVMLGLGTAQGEAASTTKSTTKAKPRAKSTATATTTKPRPLYSAERSLTRQAKIARARAQATAREIAAAIIYDPVTNKVLWEENSQDQRSIASITKMMTAVVFMESNPDIYAQVPI